MPKAFNSRALSSEKLCINKEFHAPLMPMYLTFHMQDSGQFAVEAIDKTAYVRVMQIRIL